MDFPLEQMASEAAVHVLAGSTVWQKWTCRHCGSRQTMEEQNKFFTSGRCEECQQITIIQECGYTLLIRGAS